MFCFLGMNAQLEVATVNKVEDASPVVSDFDLFINKFENWNIGNLHIYTRPDNVMNLDYYFKGDKLTADDRPFLPLDLQRKMIVDQESIYAVGSIRHTGENNFSNNDMYLLRMNERKSPNQIMLYELKNKQLVPRRVLAYNKKVWGGYLQLDTWIQDVNGDTFLDLIQKGRKVTKKGKVRKEQTKVFLLQPNGSYEEGSTELINEEDYLFEDIIK